MKKIEICFRNYRDESSLRTAVESVRFLLFSTERANLKNNKIFISGNSSLVQSIVDCDIWTISPEKVRIVIPEEAKKWLRCRDRILELNSLLDACPVNQETFDLLCELDKLFVKLQAHKNNPSIVMDTSILDGTNIGVLVKAYMEGATERHLKAVLVTLFHKIMSKSCENSLLYPVKIRKSDLQAADLAGFSAQFCSGITADDGGRAVWNFDFSKSAQLKALSDLFVILFDSEQVEVIK